MVQCKKQICFHQQEHIADYHKEGAEEFLHSVGDRDCSSMLLKEKGDWGQQMLQALVEFQCKAL